jgi:hypothetical protein
MLMAVIPGQMFITSKFDLRLGHGLLMNFTGNEC